MANPDAEYIVERPPGMLVTVTRERFKDSPALDPLSYEGRSVDLGRYDAYGEPVTSLALVSSAPPPRILKQPNGKVQRQLLSGLRNLQKDAKDTLVWTLADLRQVARSSGASKQAAFTAAEALTLTGFLTPSVGGYIIAKDSQIDG